MYVQTTASYPGALIDFDVAWRVGGKGKVSEQRTSIPARASRNQLAHQSAWDEAVQTITNNIQNNSLFRVTIVVYFMKKF
jgi:hypothetical protein